MENIGALAILLAFCFAVYAIIGSLVGKWAKRPFLALSAQRAVYSVWALLTSAVGSKVLGSRSAVQNPGTLEP